MSKTVILTSGVSGRYASALFALGEESDGLKMLDKDLDTLLGLISDSEDFRNLITSPIYKRAEQMNAILALTKKLKLQKNITNFLCLLAQKRRLYILGKVIADFKLLLQDKNGEMSAEVVASKSLTKSQLIEIEKTLRGAIGKKVNLSVEVDETLISGLILKIGSKMIDTTIKSKLLKLQTTMKEVN